MIVLHRKRNCPPSASMRYLNPAPLCLRLPTGSGAALAVWQLLSIASGAASYVGMWGHERIA